MTIESDFLDALIPEQGEERFITVERDGDGFRCTTTRYCHGKRLPGSFQTGTGPTISDAMRAMTHA